jgi:uncharacterized protein
MSIRKLSFQVSPDIGKVSAKLNAPEKASCIFTLAHGAGAGMDHAFMKAQELLPALPLFVSGKSFGGRMSSQYLAANAPADVQGIVFYGFPLHQINKPSVERAEHLKEVKVPMLFLQGTKDALAEWDLIEAVCKSLKKATLIKLEGADHSFKAGKKDIMSPLVDATKSWTEKLLKAKR